MEQNDRETDADYRGDAVTGEGGVGSAGGPAPEADPYRGDEVTGEGGVGSSDVPDVDPDPVDDANPETNGAG
jgi:hypothetical protein